MYGDWSRWKHAMFSYLVLGWHTLALPELSLWPGTLMTVRWDKGKVTVFVSAIWVSEHSFSFNPEAQDTSWESETWPYKVCKYVLSWPFIFVSHFGCWIGLCCTAISFLSGKGLPQQWLTESQNILGWKGPERILESQLLTPHRITWELNRIYKSVVQTILELH